MAIRFSRMQGYVLLLAGVLITGTIAIMVIEGLSAFDTVYFVVVTLATVGYGDISPTGTAGRAVTMILIIAGVGTFVAVFAGIIEMLFTREEQRKRRKKINMIIGVFFSEFGTAMLSRVAGSGWCSPAPPRDFSVSASWTRKDFNQLRKDLLSREFRISDPEIDFSGIKKSLLGKREFFLTLLEHPMIFEHESFTELLQAWFHLTEELGYRDNPAALTPADRAHLMADLERGCRLLAFEWVGYMEHLQEHYPYLFSLAARTNPFTPEIPVELE